MFRYKDSSMINDEFTSTIALAFRKAMKEHEGKNEEHNQILYEMYKRSADVWDSLCIHGLEMYGMSYEKFLEQCETKKNIMFLSDDELDDYYRARKIMEFMRE